MIARTWHGRVAAAQADAYHAYLLRTGLGDYASTPGNRGVQALRRTEGDITHFLLITLWDSLDAIRAFAGPDYDQARYYAITRAGAARLDAERREWERSSHAINLILRNA